MVDKLVLKLVDDKSGISVGIEKLMVDKLVLKLVDDKSGISVGIEN